MKTNYLPDPGALMNRCGSVIQAEGLTPGPYCGLPFTVGERLNVNTVARLDEGVVHVAESLADVAYRGRLGSRRRREDPDDGKYAGRNQMYQLAYEGAHTAPSRLRTLPVRQHKALPHG